VKAFAVDAVLFARAAGLFAVALSANEFCCHGTTVSRLRWDEKSDPRHWSV